MSGKNNRDHIKQRVDVRIKKILLTLRHDVSRRDAFEILLFTVQYKSDLLQSYRSGRDRSQDVIRYINALLRITKYYASFVRPIGSWIGGAGSSRNLFHSLLQHVFAEFSMPRFMDEIWMEDAHTFTDERCQQYLGLASGASMRNWTLPVPMTKRMKHFFMQAPDHYSYMQALRYGQLKGLAAEDWLIKTIINSKLGHNLGDEVFHNDLLRFFVHYQDKGLFSEEIEEIIGYFDRVRENNAQCEVLDLSDYTLNSLLEFIRNRSWYQQLLSKRPSLTWSHSGLKGIEVCVPHPKSGKAAIHWHLYELLDSEALRKEGGDLHHCVGSYASRCRDGYSTIWSLGKIVSNYRYSVLTIELNPRTRCIVQVKGYYNRSPRMYELEIVKQWANQNDIGF